MHPASSHPAESLWRFLGDYSPLAFNLREDSQLGAPPGRSFERPDRGRLRNWLRLHGPQPRQPVHQWVFYRPPRGLRRRVCQVGDADSDAESLALSLYEVGHVVSIVNPAHIAAHAKSRLARTKTDKADAALIAHFCRTQQPLPWTPPPAVLRELQARVRRVEMLQEMAQQEVNRLRSGLPSPAVRASIEATLAFLRQEMAQMQRLVQEQVEQSADLQPHQRLLCSIPGIGRWTAARVLAESDQVRTSLSARQLAA